MLGELAVLDTLDRQGVEFLSEDEENEEYGESEMDEKGSEEQDGEKYATGEASDLVEYGEDELSDKGYGEEEGVNKQEVQSNSK